MGFKRKDKGGISFTSTVTPTHLDLETVKAICGEYKIHNADISLRFDATADDLIDVIEGNRIYMPCIYVVNKVDQITIEELHVLDRLPHYCPVRWGTTNHVCASWETSLNPSWQSPHLVSRTCAMWCLHPMSNSRILAMFSFFELMPWNMASQMCVIDDAALYNACILLICDEVHVLCLQCPSRVELGWAFGKNLGISGFNTCLHKTTGHEPRLWRSCYLTSQEMYCWRLLWANP